MARRRPARYLDYLISLAAGGILIYSMTIFINMQIKNGPVVHEHLVLTGAALGALVLIINIMKFKRAVTSSSKDFIVLKSETGSVRVHASAIEEALRYTAKQLSGVHDVNVRLVIDKQTHVPSAGEVEARISDITNIVSVHDALSRMLSERYAKIIPGAPMIDFHLTIKHHFKPPAKKKKEIIPPEEDETKAIRAPQYPVPDKD